MTIRSASWLAAAALAAATAPAHAQDGRYHPGPPPPLPEVDAWDEEWEHSADEAYDVEESRWEDEPHGDGYAGEPGEWRGRPMPAHDAHRGPAFGYPPEQRAQWLAQCRASYDERSGRERGQAIGGVLGAVAGGIAGNRIADGERLGGTLIGAGVGGIAGVAIGGAIGAEADRDRLDECEGYLVRHEQSYAGYGHGPAQGYAPGAVGYRYPYPYPVMWVKVPVHTVRRGDCGCETVVEEWVEEEPAPRPARAKRVKIRRIAPAAAPGKRVRTTK